MKLVSLVESDHDTSGCDYALIDLNRDLARIALGRLKAFKAHKKTDPQLDEMYFWDSHVEYFSPWNAKEGDEGDSLSEVLGKLPVVTDDLMRVPDDSAIPENSLARVDCSEMIIRDDTIAFIAIPKHASYYVRTAEIPLQTIEAASVGNRSQNE
jgi:hypothetical protein